MFIDIQRVFYRIQDLSKACFRNIGHAWDTELNSMTYFRHFLRVIVWHLHAMSFFIFCFFDIFTLQKILNLYAAQDGFHVQIALNLLKYFLFYSLSTLAPPF